jgi:hypothetical protein
MSVVSPAYKAWKQLAKKNLANVRVSEDWVSIASSKAKNFLSVDPGGVSIGGPISYQGLPGQIVFGGLLTFPFFPLMFLPIGPTLVPSLALTMVAINASKLATALTALTP